MRIHHFQTCLKQELAYFPISVIACLVQRRLAARVAGVHFCSVVEQKLHDSSMAVLNCKAESSPAALWILAAKNFENQSCPRLIAQDEDDQI